MNMKKSTFRPCPRQLFFAGLSLLIMGLIFRFSAQDAQASSALSSPFSAFLQQLLQGLPEGLAVFLVRKGAHFSIYAALGFCVVLSLTPALAAEKASASSPDADGPDIRIRRNWQPVWLSLLICALYACSDEIHQLMVPGRSGQISDVLLDTAGSLCGILAALLLLVLFRKLRSRRRTPV